MLRDRLGVSERWGCKVVGQQRSTQRREPKRAEDDAALRGAMRKFSEERPRGGTVARTIGCASWAGR
jgi:putative transposase